MQNETDTALDLDAKLVEHFPGKIVRKDLTKRLKEGANVPVYVLEYLLGMYCSSADEEQIAEGMERVKQVLSQNYVRPDEAEKIKARIRESGNFKIIDKVTVRLNEKKDQYEAILYCQVDAHRNALKFDFALSIAEHQKVVITRLHRLSGQA